MARLSAIFVLLSIALAARGSDQTEYIKFQNEEGPAPVLAAASQDDIGASPADRADYLKFHNQARAQHGAKALTYNLELEGFAQQWANNCVFHHSGGKFGRIGCVKLLVLCVSKFLNCVLWQRKPGCWYWHLPYPGGG